MKKNEIKKFVLPLPSEDQSPVGQSPSLAKEAGKAVISEHKTASQVILEAESKINHQRKIMNAIKCILPIMSAIISKPGAASSPQDKADAINRMTGLASEASSLLISNIAPDLINKGWVNAEIFGLCTSIISDEWNRSGDLNNVQALLDPGFIQSVSSGLSDIDSKSIKWLESSMMTPSIINESDSATRIRLSLLKAAAPLLLDINNFSFWKQYLNSNNHNEVRLFSTKLINTLSSVAAENANRQADNFGMDSNHRISLWQGTISRTFKIARDEYCVIALRAIKESDSAANSKLRNEVRRQWAKDEKGDIALMIGKTSDAMINLLDGIVNKTMVQCNNKHLKTNYPS